MDVQVAIHTDTLNESGFVEATVAAFKGRAIHTYHTEGAGGGQALQHALVDGARIDAVGEIGEVGEFAGFSRINNRFHRGQ